jgi:hypothetical protein
MEIKIKVEDDKSITVEEVNSYGNQAHTIKGLTPEQGVDIKRMLERAKDAGRHEERRRILDSIKI